VDTDTIAAKIKQKVAAKQKPKTTMKSAEPVLNPI